MTSPTLLILHASHVVTPTTGWKLRVIKDGAVAVQGDTIIAVGTTEEVVARWGGFQTRGTRSGVANPGPSYPTVIEARGKLVCPGFVDPHTHLVYAGSRAKEFALRLAGMPYMEIARRGGGINSTVRATRKASHEELFDSAAERLGRMLAWGTTTAEVKSGYGLSLSSEIKMLEVIRDLAASFDCAQDEQPVELVPTFLGAHEIPNEYRNKPGDYVDLIVEKMIPRLSGRAEGFGVRRATAALLSRRADCAVTGMIWPCGKQSGGCPPHSKAFGLAEFCDVFCEEGVFTVEESKRILVAGKEYGMTPKIHADEIVYTGGAELAAQVGAASADHLVHVSREGISEMVAAGVVPVLLPGTSFFLNSDYAPAREMIEAGLSVALGTDHNPGTCTIEGMPMIIALACLKLKMTPEEALIAATLNAAKAIRRDHIIGSLAPGKQADILILDVPDYREIPYRFGTNPVRTVINKGKVI